MLHFGVTEFPSLRVVISKHESAEAMLQTTSQMDVAEYFGGFKFGAFDRIKAFLTEKNFADPPLATPDLEEGTELDASCGSSPCVLLLTDGNQDDVVLHITRQYAGEIVTVIHVDTTAYPIVANSFQLRPGQLAAVFLGPLSSANGLGGEKEYMQRTLKKKRTFTKLGLEKFVRATMSRAGEAEEAGEAEGGLTQLRQLPVVWSERPAPTDEDGELVVSEGGEDSLSDGNKKLTKKEKRDAKKAAKHDSADIVLRLRGIKAKSLRTFVAKRALTLVAYVASGKVCSPCDKLKALMESTVQSLAATEGAPQADLVSVKLHDEGDRLTEQMVQFGVEKLPALVFYRYGAAREWDLAWPVDADTLYAAVVREALEPSTDAQTDTALDHPHERGEVQVIVGGWAGNNALGEALQAEKLLLIAFYEPLAPESEALLLHCRRAARQLQEQPVRIMLVDVATVDADSQSKLGLDTTSTPAAHYIGPIIESFSSRSAPLAFCMLDIWW